MVDPRRRDRVQPETARRPTPRLSRLGPAHPAQHPVDAITAGTVVNTTRFNQNWWQAGCTGALPGGCQTCGLGLPVQSDIGRRYTYCHNSAVFVDVGQQVAAGQQVSLSGDTGHSGAPHVHIEFRINNVQYCRQPIMHAVYNGGTGAVHMYDQRMLLLTGC